MRMLNDGKATITYPGIACAIIEGTFRISQHALERRSERAIPLYTIVKSIPTKLYPYYIEKSMSDYENTKIVICINDFRFVWGCLGGHITLVTIYVHEALMGLEVSERDYWYALREIINRAS
jgi:hypothetical protein